MSKKRPRLWYLYTLMGILYHRAWALLIIWDRQFPEPQLSNELKFPRLCL